ncbi:hypothetical protein DFH09DRAFT_1422817 [Mycena vulgaris]|nr:hypothetical protein DFH09DRAFT_1422817 [Mycena vulgaris]
MSVLHPSRATLCSPPAVYLARARILALNLAPRALLLELLLILFLLPPFVRSLFLYSSLVCFVPSLSLSFVRSRFFVPRALSTPCGVHVRPCAGHAAVVRRWLLPHLSVLSPHTQPSARCRAPGLERDSPHAHRRSAARVPLRVVCSATPRNRIVVSFPRYLPSLSFLILILVVSGPPTFPFLPSVAPAYRSRLASPPDITRLHSPASPKHSGSRYFRVEIFAWFVADPKIAITPNEFHLNMVGLDLHCLNADSAWDPRTHDAFIAL